MTDSRTLTLGSLFDGSGGFPLGGILSGIEPVWSSEIEPFPILVTHKRLPDMKHYGDVSTLRGGELEPVDIITFGSPCQDMSIAGRRAGLDGERSGLFFQAIRVIKEMKEATNGKYPRYCVWENVPGAFSSNKGEDFRAVLEAVIGIKEEGIEVPPPENNRWAKADVLLGDGWSVAYRVFDAQYWGVPQRRARIYLVADLNGGSAGEILFKSEGLSGYSAEGVRSWQRAAGRIEESAGEAGRSDEENGVTYCVNPQGSSGVAVTEDKTLTLVAQDHGNHPSVLRSAGFSTEHSAQSRSIGYEEEKSPTLRAGVVPAAMELFENHSQVTRFNGSLEVAQPVTATYGMGGNNQPLVVENHPTDGRVKIRKDSQCQTLTERMGTGGGNVPLVAEPEPMTLKIRCGKEGGGKGALIQRDKSATLGTNNDQTLFQPVDTQNGEPRGFDRYNGKVTGDIVHTLDTGAGNTVPMVFEPCDDDKAYAISRIGFNGGEKAAFNFAVDEEKSPTLETGGPHAVAKPEIKAYGVCSKNSHAMLSDNPKSGFYEAETSRTLDRSGGNAVTSNQGGICVVAPISKEQPTFDVRFTSEGTKVMRGHVYSTDTSRALGTDKPDPAGNHGGVAVLALESGAASRIGGHIYEDGKSGALRANAGDNSQAVVAFTQNQRDEVRDLEGKSGALQAQPGMKQQTYVLQGSMIGRDDKNGPQGDGVSEDISYTLNTCDKHAVTQPTYAATVGSFMKVSEERAQTLMARDYKDPQIVNDTLEEPMYIVRRLTPQECALLQGFPAWWCKGLAIPDPTDEEITFWTEVWETWRSVTNPGGKPKTEKQIRKWLTDPYTDAAEYKLWGNGLCVNIAYFVLSGIKWAYEREAADG